MPKHDSSSFLERALGFDFGKSRHENLKNVVSMDYDYSEQMIYFADVGAKTIFKSKIGAPETKTAVINHDAKGLEGIALDWINKKLYWVDRQTQHLNVAELDGRNRRTLVTDIKDPRAIVVHPGIGYIFFTSWHLDAYIGKINVQFLKRKDSELTVLIEP